MKNKKRVNVEKLKVLLSSINKKVVKAFCAVNKYCYIFTDSGIIKLFVFLFALIALIPTIQSLIQ